MNKQVELIKLLLKTSKIGKGEEGKSSVEGNFSELLIPALTIAFAVGMFFAGRYIGENPLVLGSADKVFTALIIAAGSTAFVLSLMQAINNLYMTSDLDVLVTLPVTPVQIVVAKLASVCSLPGSICMGLIIPTAIGYFTVAEGLSPLFLVAMVVGSLITAAWSISIATFLIIVLMRCFKFLRSKNLVSLITALGAFVLFIAYMLVINASNGSAEEAAVGAAAAFVGASSGMGLLFPFAQFVASAAFGNVVDLAIALVIGAASMALVALAAKLFYFQAALAMTDANGSRSKLSQKGMQKALTKNSQTKALFWREVRTTLRTPALTTNGFLLCLVAPFVLLVPLFLNVSGNLEGMGASLDDFRALTAVFPAPVFLLAGSLAGFLLSSVAVGLSSLSRYVISREGKDLSALRAMPISLYTLVSAKRLWALIVNGFAGFLVPTLAFVAAGVLGLMPLWIAGICAVVTFCWLLFCINVCAYIDVRKPDLNWESESSVTKNNTPGVIIFFVALALLAGVAMGFGAIDQPEALLWPVALAFVVVPIALAAGSEAMLRKAAKAL